jgi:hypothetical protein
MVIVVAENGKQQYEEIPSHDILYRAFIKLPSVAVKMRIGMTSPGNEKPTTKIVRTECSRSDCSDCSSKFASSSFW